MHSTGLVFLIILLNIEFNKTDNLETSSQKKLNEDFEAHLTVNRE